MSATTPPAALPPQVQLHVDWSGASNLPVMASNVFLIQQTPHEFVVTFGVAAPPLLERPLTLEEAQGMRIVPQPLIRLALAPGRVVELLQLLQQQILAYQQAQKQ
jgi:hypothetical protein